MTTWASMPAHLVTDRLQLGPWTEDDLEPFHAMVYQRDPRTAAAPRDGRPTRDDLRRKLDQRQRDLSETGIALLAIRIDDEFAGYCGLVTGRASLDEPELAYELLASFQGHGYATDAARAIVSSAAATGRTRLWASVRPWNQPSFRVLTKVGFELSDRVTDDDFGRLVWWTRELST